MLLLLLFGGLHGGLAALAVSNERPKTVHRVSMNCGTVEMVPIHRRSHRGCCCLFVGGRGGDCFAKVLDVKAYVDCCSSCSCQLSCLCCMKSGGLLARTKRSDS